MAFPYPIYPPEVQGKAHYQLICDYYGLFCCNRLHFLPDQFESVRGRAEQPVSEDQRADDGADRVQDPGHLPDHRLYLFPSVCGAACSRDAGGAG
ncbi:hypothetical protein D3C76_1396060 [compost metagenome]